MGDDTAISWADKTHNVWIGCAHADADAPGSGDRETAAELETAAECDNCYAEAWDARKLHGDETHWGPTAPRRFLSDAYWRKPLAWDREAAGKGIRFRVFCSSLADAFERHAAPEINARMDQERRRLWALIRRTPNLDWLLLTKRPENFQSMLPWLDGDEHERGESGPFCRDCADNAGTCPTDGMPCDPAEPWPNVWLGVTAAVRRSFWRIEYLRRTPAAVHFISGEPLLEHITSEAWDRALDPMAAGALYDVDWLIVGDENGPRRAELDWVRTARDAAARNGVAFHFKQWCGPDATGLEPRAEGKRKVHLPILDERRHDARPVRR